MSFADSSGEVVADVQDIQYFWAADLFPCSVSEKGLCRGGDERNIGGGGWDSVGSCTAM